MSSIKSLVILPLTCVKIEIGVIVVRSTNIMWMLAIFMILSLVWSEWLVVMRSNHHRYNHKTRTNEQWTCSMFNCCSKYTSHLWYRAMQVDFNIILSLEIDKRKIYGWNHYPTIVIFTQSVPHTRTKEYDFESHHGEGSFVFQYLEIYSWWEWILEYECYCVLASVTLCTCHTWGTMFAEWIK